MAGQQVEQGMKFTTKLGLYAVGGILLVTFILSFGIVGIVVAGALAFALLWGRSKVAEKGKAGVAGEMAREPCAALVHVLRAGF